MKQFTAILFLLAFVCQSYKKPFIMADYYANTAAYAKNCINKAKPKMNCNGKCQAMKKIQEEEKKEQDANQRKFENKIEIFPSAIAVSSIIFQPLVVINKTYFSANAAPVKDLSFAIFHPPRV